MQVDIPVKGMGGIPGQTVTGGSDLAREINSVYTAQLVVRREQMKTVARSG